MTDHEHPIAAPATALVRSALSVVRCSGLGAIELVGKLFAPPGTLENAPGYTIHHGTLSDLAGDPVDDVMVAVMRAPGGFTGEDSVEIYGHGSPAGVRRILEALYEVGFHPAAPGEFTRRAFLNGKLDLTRAEAINDVVNAQTVRAHKLALSRLEGGIHTALQDIRGDLISLMAALSVQLDYPEEETPDASFDTDLLRSCHDRVVSLASTYEHGRLVQEGISVALAGRTNAGKSSLFNTMLRQDRSIVSDLPGTTRDYLEANLDIGGLPVRLFDTAGLRPGDHRGGDSVEAEGIRRSGTVIAAADLVLYVVDGTVGIEDEDRKQINGIREQKPVVIAWNKSDLSEGAAGRTSGDVGSRGSDSRIAKDSEAPCVTVSALTGDGIEELNSAIVCAVDSTLAGPAIHDSGVVIDSARQHHLLMRAANALNLTLESHSRGLTADVLSVDLQDALGAIGEITGEITTDEVLETMFSSFCLGK